MGILYRDKGYFRGVKEGILKEVKRGSFREVKSENFRSAKGEILDDAKLIFWMSRFSSAEEKMKDFGGKIGIKGF